MKTNERKELSLIQIVEQFPTEQAAREHLEQIRWADGIVCPHCKCSDQSKFSTIAANPEKKVRAGLRWCSDCERQFTVTVGTIFEDSHIPLRKWLMAWYMICSSKKGVSSLQLQRQLELGSYRTALFMTHRIRFALKDPAFNEKLEGVVEVDETYIGGKPRRGDGKIHKRGRGTSKAPVVVLVQRNGNARATSIRRLTDKNIKSAILINVHPDSQIMTDEFPRYVGIGKHFAGGHATVNHGQGEYARGNVNTNTVESYFAILKRGVYGTFHSVSKQHLPLYLAEFDHRWNHRKSTDGQRTIAGLRKVEGKRLTYKAAI